MESSYLSGQVADSCPSKAVSSRLHSLADVILLAESEQLANVVGPLGPAHPGFLVICQPRQGARPCKVSQPFSFVGHWLPDALERCVNPGVG